MQAYQGPPFPGPGPRSETSRTARIVAIAEGVIPFPVDVPAEDIQNLAAAVRQVRRDVLTQFLARQVAASILRDEATGQDERANWRQ